MAEGVSDTCEAYSYIKERQIVDLATFRIAQGNRECILQRHEDAKFRIMAAQHQVNDLERDLKLYKDQYFKLKDQMQQHDNVVRFVNVKREDSKEN